MLSDFVGVQVADVGLACFDELHSVFVHLLKVVRSVI